MISVAEADVLLAAALPASTIESIALDTAVGRVLARPLLADRDGPPYDRVAMDGYAIDSREDRTQWAVSGLQTAGRPPVSRAEIGTAVEVATGAVLPRGCDTVVPYELTVKATNAIRLADGVAPLAAGKNVHRQGSDYRAGQTLLPSGTRLASPHLHSLASVGSDPVEVLRRAQWALVATGDELVEVRDEPLAWQIRRSNAAAITGEARAWGLSPVAQIVLPDHRDRIRAGLDRLLPGLDVLVLTGGVSAGVLDLVPEVLVELGVEVLFHKLAQRPGKPLWCGRIPATDHRPQVMVFGLPGNPVSSLVSFRRYVLPWLLAFEGQRAPERRIPLTSRPTPPSEGWTLYLPWSDRGGLLEGKGSGDFAALHASTGFVELDSDPRSLVEPRYFPWGGTL